MKVKVMITSYLMTFFAYIISYLLLCTVPSYQSWLLGQGAFYRNFIMTHLSTGIFLILVYYFGKSVQKATGIVCIIICSFAVLPHSKMFIGSDEIDKYLSAEISAAIFLSVIILLMCAFRIKKHLEDWNKWKVETQNIEYVDLILKQRIKFYTFFIALVTGICLILIGGGFLVLYANASALFTIVIAITGLIMLAGCVVFVSRKIAS